MKFCLHRRKSGYTVRAGNCGKDVPMSIAKTRRAGAAPPNDQKSCTIDRLCGCYVDGRKNVVLKFSESFSGSSGGIL